MTTLWLVYDPGGRDDPLELYGVFTTEEKAQRAAKIAGDCLTVDSVQLDALYLGEPGRGWPTPGALHYPQPEPNTDWDHMVVDSGAPSTALERR